MKRVLALLAAVALVVAAVVLRHSLDADEVETGGGGGGGGGGSALTVACIPELQDVCHQLVRVDDVVVQDPAATIADPDAVDAWVTLDPWPDIAAFTSRDDLFSANRTIVGHADLTLLTRNGTVPQGCGGAAGWVCLSAGLPPHRLAIPSPDSAAGLLVLGWATATWSAAELPGEAFSRDSIRNPAFQQFADAIDMSKHDPLGDVLTFGQTAAQAVGTTTVDARRLGGTREETTFTALATSAPATVAVVITGPAAGRVAGEPTLGESLQTNGWTPGPDTATSGIVPAGVLFALQEEFG